MKKLFLWGLLCAIPTLLRAQLGDSFSDADWPNQPEWLGDTALFDVTPDSQLQLQAPAATGSAWLYLYAPTNLGDSTVWELSVRLDFAPSDNNRFVYWLACSGPDPVNGQGYFLKVGENGSLDALRLYRQDGPGQAVLLASGTAGAVSNLPWVRVHIVRDPQGFWQMGADYTGGWDFQPEGATVRDTVYGQSAFAGLWCRYTSSNAQKFFFDDFSVGPIWVDTEPPALLSTTLRGDSVVALSFSEPLAAATAEYLGNYAIFPSVALSEAGAEAGAPQTVVLTLAERLLPGMVYALRIEGLTDAAGNEMDEVWTNLRYEPPVRPIRHELILTELYADPSPSFGLPGHEFVELYNRGARPLPLGGLRILDGAGTESVLPDDTLAPGGFLLLCGVAGAAELSAYGPTRGLSVFPSLNDDGDTLRLLGPDGEVLDAVGYDRNTYGDPAKAAGGWTLARRDYDRPCLLRGAWAASKAVWLGGTPGQREPLAEPYDVPPFRAERVWPLDERRLCVWFSQGLSVERAGRPESYPMVGGASVESVALVPPLFDCAVLTLAAPLSPGQWVGLCVSDSLSGCGSDGQALVADTLWAALPEPPMPGDVVVNELLFDPLPYGSDFVELYNVSPKMLALGDLLLADVDATGFPLHKVRLPDRRLLYPGAFCVLTPDTAFISGRYPCSDPRVFLSSELPEMPDDSGRLALLGLVGEEGGRLLETVRYEARWHSALLEEAEGVSLERRDPAVAADGRMNWASSGGFCGRSTPGLPNAAGASNGADTLSGGDWALLPELVFTPDGDGWEDELRLHYDVSGTEGLRLNVRIYDARGVWAAELVQGLFVQGSGSLYWDGALGDGAPAPPGPYILRAEAVGPSGEVWRKKLVGVLERR